MSPPICGLRIRKFAAAIPNMCCRGLRSLTCYPAPSVFPPEPVISGSVALGDFGAPADLAVLPCAMGRGPLGDKWSWTPGTNGQLIRASKGVGDLGANNTK